MMKEMIRKVMEWCKLWNGETATAKQADPSSDKSLSSTYKCNFLGADNKQ